MDKAYDKAIQAVTLYEGDYHLGVAVLANSLYHKGYRGTLWVGYRGPMPPWLKGEAIDHDPFPRYQIADDFYLGFVPVAPGPFVAHAKPYLLSDLAAALPQAQGLIFFDADSLITASWSYFEKWIEGGVAGVICVTHGLMPEGHPWRQAWRVMAAELGYECRDLTWYVLMCFLGLKRPHFDLLTCWAKATDLVLERYGTELGQLKHKDPNHPFHNPEQNSLNLALMASRAPLALAGPEAAGQTFGAPYFLTSLSGIKAWRGGFVKQALCGGPPGRYERAFWGKEVEGPIRAFDSGTIGRSRLGLRLAGFISRFYRRG